MTSVVNPAAKPTVMSLSAAVQSVRSILRQLPGSERFARLYRGIASAGIAAAPLCLWLGIGWGLLAGVVVGLIVDHSLRLGRHFLVWTASWFLIWSISVQAGAQFLPLHDEFWRVLVAVWKANGNVEREVYLPLLACPLAWFALGYPASIGLDALFKRIRRDRIERPLLVASATVFTFSWSAPETPGALLIGVTVLAGIIGMVMNFIRSKLVRSAATIDNKIEALETGRSGTQVREINVLALGQAGRPKRFVFDDEEVEAATTLIAPISYAAPTAGGPAVRPEEPVEEPIELTPDASLWDEDGGGAVEVETGAADEGEGQVSDVSEDTQDLVFDDSLFASNNGLGSEAGLLGDEVTGDMNFDAGETVNDDARRAAFMDARKLVDAYHLLSEQAATSDDLVSVREAVSTLADMIGSTTQLSRDCLLEIDHPEVIDGWILSATLDEHADIEREIYDHFISPAAEAADEFATPVLGSAEKISSQPGSNPSGAPEWEMGTTIVLETGGAEEPVPEELVIVAVPDEARSEEGTATATVPEKPIIPTPLLEGDINEDEKSLLEDILEDRDLLENGLRAIAAYDFRPKALSLLSGRIGALLRARWSEVVGDLRHQRVFMTVLERVDDELYEKVGIRRGICSIRFTTSLVQEDTEAFLMEVEERLNSGIDTKEDYDFLLACRDKLESLTEAFGEVVPSLTELAQRFRKDLEASGRVYAEPLTPVVTELTGVHAIDPGSIKRGMGHVLASSLDQNDRDLLDGFIAVAKSVKTLEQRVMMESMRRQTDVSTHPLYDSVMALKQEALARAKALQDRVTLSGGGETRLKNMLLSGGEDAAEVFAKILGSAQEVENYRVDGKSKSALLASLESQMAALNRLNEEHAVEKRELRKQADANLTSDSIEAHISLLAEVFSQKKNAGNHKMVTDAETVLTRPKTGPAQAIYRTKDITYAFCFVYGQGRNDWYIKDAEMLLCRSNAVAISLKQARAQVGALAEVQTEKVRMRFIMVHGNVEAGMGIAFSAKQAIEQPDLLMKPSELDRGLENASGDEQQVRPAA
jgi:hypothetical protein